MKIGWVGGSQKGIAAVWTPNRHDKGAGLSGSEAKRQDVPQALQILFPASSLLQSGVVDVPQLAQLNAPTVAAAPGVFAFMRIFPLGSGDAAGDVDGPGAATSVGVVEDCAEATSALLNVGHPEQADVPPVPSQRPSPGQVPPR